MRCPVGFSTRGARRRRRLRRRKLLARHVVLWAWTCEARNELRGHWAFGRCGVIIPAVDGGADGRQTQLRRDLRGVDPEGIDSTPRRCATGAQVRSRSGDAGQPRGTCAGHDPEQRREGRRRICADLPGHRNPCGLDPPSGGCVHSGDRVSSRPVPCRRIAP